MWRRDEHNVNRMFITRGYQGVILYPTQDHTTYPQNNLEQTSKIPLIKRLEKQYTYPHD